MKLPDPLHNAKRYRAAEVTRKFLRTKEQQSSNDLPTKWGCFLRMWRHMQGVYYPNTKKTLTLSLLLYLFLEGDESFSCIWRAYPGDRPSKSFISTISPQLTGDWSCCRSSYSASMSFQSRVRWELSKELSVFCHQNLN